MLQAKCKVCGNILKSSPKVQFCGCENQMRVLDDLIGAIDMKQVILLTHNKKIKYKGILTKEDLKYQEARRKRRVRKLDYEER